MLLSFNNVSNWDHHLKMKLTAFPDVGSFHLAPPPTVNDLIEDTQVRKYNFQIVLPDVLTASSLNNFLKAQAAFKKEDKDRRDEEAKVCHLIHSSLSEEASLHLRSVAAFLTPSDDNDSYAMYTIAKNEHSRSSSFAVAQSLFQQLLAIKKTGTFAQLVHDLADHRRKFCAIFDPTAKSTVPIDDIWVMLLMNALPDEEFLFMKETMYAKDLKVAFPQFAVVLQEMQNYDLNKKKAIPKPEAITPVGPTILSASTTVPAETKCGICSKMFNWTMKRDGSGEFLNCYTCTAAAAAIPTAAQVKKAQAVALLLL